MRNMNDETAITEYRRFSITEPSASMSRSGNQCRSESCNGWWILSDGKARPCMTCRRRRHFEAVPKRFRIRLEDLRPTELLAGRISLEQQARLLELIRSRPQGNFLLMGRSGCGKTQLLHSMYLNEVESNPYGATVCVLSSSLSSAALCTAEWRTSALWLKLPGRLFLVMEAQAVTWHLAKRGSL